MNPLILISCDLCRLLHEPAHPLALHAICRDCAAPEARPALSDLEGAVGRDGIF